MAEQCPIWKTTCRAIVPDENSLIVTDSPRAGGSYQLYNDAAAALRDMTVDDKARLTTILVRERFLGNDCPSINGATIAQAMSAGNMPMREKLDNLLRCLIGCTPKAGALIDIGYLIDTGEPEPNFEARINQRFAFAYSESTELHELELLTDSLAQQGFIEKHSGAITGKNQFMTFSRGSCICKVTSDGYIATEQRQTEVKSNQCFVAMWFNEATDALCDRAISPAVLAAGYRPLRIDRQPDFLGKIDDQIIAEIRRSRFMIADFTHGDDGARGSVYYEVGFAQGLDLPVIFTCRDDQLDDLHFDTNHFLHLPWPRGYPEALIEPLKNRILANIGAGPNISAGDGNA